MFHAEVQSIRQKMLRNPWPKFVRSLSISGLRGWAGQQIRFEFPVCAIAGENGCGKSTVLKSIASLYDDPSGDKKKRLFPSDFFPQTTWDDVTDVELRYDIVQGGETVNYTIKKPTKRWRLSEPRPKRKVIWQDISRTLPLSATIGYAKVANAEARETASRDLSNRTVSYYSSIMGKQYKSARICNLDSEPDKDVGVIGIDEIEYSQFHQGAGEDATFDLLALLQDVPDTSLIVIDEIEASLHPRSQRRLIHYLLWIARTKNIQVIVSTHSGYILEELPEEGRIFLEKTSDGPVVKYGISPDYALNRMDDLNRPSHYVFSEDDESIIAAKAILRSQQFDFRDIGFVAVGPANVVAAIGSATRRVGFPVLAAGLLDADQEEHGGCLRLPGQLAPEKEIFQSILDGHVERLAGRLNKPEHDVRQAIEGSITIPDCHIWPKRIAGFLGESSKYVWETVCRLWAEEILSEAEITNFVNQLRAMLDR